MEARRSGKILVFLLLLLFISHLGNVCGYGYTTYTDGNFTTIHVVIVDPKEHQIQPVRAEGKPVPRETVASMAHRFHAAVAVNGGFWKPDGSPSGILKIDGKWHGTPTRPRAAIGWSSKDKRVLIDRVLTNYSLADCPEGVEIEVIPQSDPAVTTAEEWKEMEHIIGGTPVLVSRGQLIEDFSAEKTLQSFLVERFPRTAIGIRENGDWVFVFVENSLLGSVGGLTMKELAQWMFDLRCVDALNLCGGRSATLVIDGVNVKALPFLEQDVSDAILAIKHD